MGTINLGKTWVCPKCGFHVAKEHHQEYTGKERNGWATRKERLENPEIAEACEDAKHGAVPLVWVDDPTWVTCNQCDYELTEQELDIAKKHMQRFWQMFREGKVEVYEEIGICVINDAAINKVNFSVDK